jgi:hypothetical protein
MKQINIVAFGGLGGSWFSTGLKTLMMKLKSLGLQGAGKPIDYMTFEDYTSWKNWGGTLKNWSDPTVLIGHSFGVAAMMGAARVKGDIGSKIPLVLSYDPSQWWGWQPSLWGSGGNGVPMNVGKCVNFYQNGIPIGFQRVANDDGTVKDVENIQVTGVVHGAMDDYPPLHDRSIEEIKKVIAAL